MISTVRNDFKSTLLEASEEAVRRMGRKNDLMRECVSGKLSGSLEVYGDDLDDTCRYILTRNPIVITREMSQVMGRLKKGKKNGD